MILFVFFNVRVQKVVHQSVIEVLTTKIVVAIDRFSLKLVVTNFNEGDIKGAATKVVN